MACLLTKTLLATGVGYHVVDYNHTCVKVYKVILVLYQYGSLPYKPYKDTITRWLPYWLPVAYPRNPLVLP